MATQAPHFVQDQNLNIFYKGSTHVEKDNVLKPVKKGGHGGRKALNDISNSRKASILPSSKKNNLTNTISIEKDSTCVSGKKKFSKAPEKEKVGGRKALSDLTNSVKPPSSLQQSLRKLDSIVENVPSSMADERFLHNHAECIKAQTKVVDLDYFLKTVGLDNDTRALEPPSTKLESIVKELKMEEIPEVLFGDEDEDEASRSRKSEFLCYSSPMCQSPKSPMAPYFNWEDDDFCDLIVSKSP